MKRTTAALLAVSLCLFPVPAMSQTEGCPQAGSLTARQHEDITVSSTAIGFTSATWNPTDGSPKAVCAIVQNTGSTNIRFWAGQGAPTASSGLVLLPGSSTVVGPLNLAGFLMIRATTDSTAAVLYLVQNQ